MSVIFDEQSHPNGGLIFDEQLWSPEYGVSVISLIPAAVVVVGRGMDTDQQVILYPQGSTEFRAFQQAVLNASITISLSTFATFESHSPIDTSMNGSILATPLPAASLSRGYSMFGDVTATLVPQAATLYASGRAVLYGSLRLEFSIDGTIGYSAAFQDQGIPAIAMQLGAEPERKRRKKVLDERVSATLTVSFYNRGGLPVAPITAKYQIDCPTTGTPVRAETDLSPTVQIALLLSDQDNAMVNQDNVRELRRVTVEAVLPGGDTVNGQYDYLVRNLSGVA